MCNRPGGSCIQCRVVDCSVRFHPWCAHQKVSTQEPEFFILFLFFDLNLIALYCNIIFITNFYLRSIL